MTHEMFVEVWASLTKRQADVLTGIANGRTNPEIAATLSITADTVANHRRWGMKKYTKRNDGKRLTVPAFIALWWQCVGTAA